MSKKKGGVVPHSDTVPFELAPSIEEISGIMEAKDYSMLKKAGDVEGIAERLKTNVKSGLGAEDNLAARES
jgi:hypothetical protein